MRNILNLEDNMVIIKYGKFRDTVFDCDGFGWYIKNITNSYCIGLSNLSEYEIIFNTYNMLDAKVKKENNMKQLGLYLFVEYVVRYCNKNQVSIRSIINKLQLGNDIFNKNHASKHEITTFCNNYKNIVKGGFNGECYHYTVNEEYFK